MANASDSLRANRSAALGVLEAEISRLLVLTENRPKSGRMPTSFYEQITAVNRAREAYEKADAAYQEALHQKEWTSTGAGLGPQLQTRGPSRARPRRQR